MKLSPDKGTRSWSEPDAKEVRTKCEGSGHLYRCDKGSEDWDNFDQ